MQRVLCLPLWDASYQRYGVIQAINKLSGEAFDEEDVETMEVIAAFSPLFGLHLDLKMDKDDKDHRILLFDVMMSSVSLRVVFFWL